MTVKLERKFQELKELDAKILQVIDNNKKKINKDIFNVSIVDCEGDRIAVYYEKEIKNYREAVETASTLNLNVDAIVPVSDRYTKMDYNERVIYLLYIHLFSSKPTIPDTERTKYIVKREIHPEIIKVDDELTSLIGTDTVHNNITPYSTDVLGNMETILRKHRIDKLYKILEGK